MRKTLGLVVAVVAVAFATSARAQFTNFNAGDIVIYRIGGDAGTLDDPCNGGSGSGCLTNTGNAVFLDEYTTNGTYVQTFPLPTNYFGGYSPVLADGLAASEGVVTRSVDGRFLLVTGYGATIGQYTNASLSGEDADAVPRVVATVDQFGHVNSTTTQTNSLLNGDDIRCAVSTDGTNLWIAGAAASPIYTTRGSFIGTQISSNVVNLRTLNIFSNQLYCSDDSSTIREGVITNSFSSSTGTDALPTVASGTTQTALPGTPTSGGSPYGMAFFNLGNHNPGGPDTLYVADDGVNGGGGITKYSYSGGTWNNVGGLLATGAGVRFLTGTSDASGNVYLYITETPAFVAGSGYYPGGGTLFHYIDSAGWDQPPTDNNSDLADSSVWEVDTVLDQTFAGVAFAPVGGEAFPSQPGYLSVGPITGFFADELGCGPFNDTQTFSLANPGTNSISWSATVVDTNGDTVNWVSLSLSNSTLQETQSIRVVATLNSSTVPAFTYPGPDTNIADIIFSSSSDIVTEEVRLIQDGQRVDPGAGFVSSGPPGGPFSPTSQIYTITNNDCGGITWSVNLATTNNYFTLSATSGALGAGASTGITVSVNLSIVTNLTAGTYSDTVVFSNLTAGTQFDTRAVSLDAGALFFFDDFSTYTQNEKLEGQNGWLQNAAGNGVEIAVSNNAVVLPGNLTASGDWCFKNFPVTTNPPVFGGMLLNMTSATEGTNALAALDGGNAASTTLAAMLQYNNGSAAVNGGPSSNFTFYELAAGGPTNGLGTNFFYMAAHSGHNGATPFIVGTSTYPTGTLFRLIWETDPGGSNTTVYMNPITSNLSNQAPTFVAKPPGSISALSLGVGAISLHIYSATGSGAKTDGANIYRMGVSTNYTAVFDWITPPPVASFTNNPGSGPPPLSVNFYDTSTSASCTNMTWNWRFGDSFTSTSQNPSHTYTTSGIYTASLTVTGCGLTSTNTTATAVITVESSATYASWQSFYGLTGPLSGPDASYTGDGMSNTNKFLAGFNPTNAAAYLHIISVAKTGGGTNVTVTYLGASGDSSYSGGPTTCTNVLEFATGTANGSYSSNNFASTGQTNILSGGFGLGVVTNMVDVGGGTNNPARYYRIELLLP